MAKMAFTLMLMGLPLSVLSQTKPASSDSLRTLRSGEKIEVVETSLKKHAGTFSTVSEDAIQPREGSNEVGIRKENAARVTLLNPPTRWIFVRPYPECSPGGKTFCHETLIWRRDVVAILMYLGETFDGQVIS